MEYKGYFGSVEYSAEDKTLFGKLDGIRELVSFEGMDVNTLEQAFKEAVEDYLSLCKEEGREPEKVYKGSFNVRIRPEIHRGLVRAAAIKKINLNAVAEDAFELYLSKAYKTTKPHKDHHTV
jgi:predicted HicB family RNase H-like nuclease